MPGLIRALDNDKVAYWACIVLRNMGPVAKDAVPALAAKLNDPKLDVRREAILALASMEGAAASAVEPIARRWGTSTPSRPRPMPWAALGRFPKMPSPPSAPTSRAATRC